jgi:hypothetical protein
MRYVVHNHFPARDNSSVFIEMEAQAYKDRAQSGDSWGTSRRSLPNGGTLIYSIKGRASNSRGARRGGHDAGTFHYVAPDEKYSKQVSKERAAQLLAGKA